MVHFLTLGGDHDRRTHWAISIYDRTCPLQIPCNFFRSECEVDCIIDPSRYELNRLTLVLLRSFEKVFAPDRFTNSCEVLIEIAERSEVRGAD